MKNFENTHTISCEYSHHDHVTPELSHVINETVGKLEIRNTELEQIDQQFKQFKDSK